VIDEAVLGVLRMFRVEEENARQLVALPLPSEEAQSATAGDQPT
jgi:hypothetical protein